MSSPAPAGGRAGRPVWATGVERLGWVEVLRCDSKRVQPCPSSVRPQPWRNRSQKECAASVSECSSPDPHGCLPRLPPLQRADLQGVTDGARREPLASDHGRADFLERLIDANPLLAEA
jgi:hypothetical protein